MKFKRRLAPRAVVDLIPMIDIVFQLVIFFMVATTFKLAPGISVILPDSETAENIAMTTTIISVVNSNEIYVNDIRTTLDKMMGILGNIKKTDDEKTVHSVVISGNKNIPYELLIRIMDRIRLAGFRGISLKLKKVNK